MHCLRAHLSMNGNNTNNNNNDLMRFRSAGPRGCAASRHSLSWIIQIIMVNHDLPLLPLLMLMLRVVWIPMLMRIVKLTHADDGADAFFSFVM